MNALRASLCGVLVVAAFGCGGDQLAQDRQQYDLALSVYRQETEELQRLEAALAARIAKRDDLIQSAAEKAESAKADFVYLPGTNDADRNRFFLKVEDMRGKFADKATKDAQPDIDRIQSQIEEQAGRVERAKADLDAAESALR